jgi:hypothetical protein
MNNTYKQQELWQSTEQACTLPHVSNWCLQDLSSGAKLLALSWKEPFASLMLYGKIETRVWPTKYRGLVLICTSKKAYNHEQLYNISGNLVNDFTRKVIGRNYDHWQNNIIKQGYAIAVGRLVDCRLMTKDDESKCFVKYREPWKEERISKKTGKKKIVEVKLYCHVYEDVKPIKPIIWDGKQGWTNVSQDLIRSIELR